MRTIIILTIAGSLCLVTAAEAKGRKAHSQHASSHTARTHTATTAHAGRRAPGKDPAGLDDGKLSAGEWTPDTSFGGGKATHQASDGFGLAASGGHRREQTGLGYSAKPRRHRAS